MANSKNYSWQPSTPNKGYKTNIVNQDKKLVGHAYTQAWNNPRNGKSGRRGKKVNTRYYTGGGF